MARTTTTDSTDRPEDQRLGIGRSFGYGLQHILAMFGGVIAVPLIIGGAAGLSVGDRALLVSCSLFISGLATLLQTLGVPYFGARLPLVQGISFAAVSTMLAIVGSRGEAGLRDAYGAIIVAAAVGLVIAPAFSAIIRFFPPVVTGSIITVIGLSLMPVAAGWITGQATITVDGQSQANPDYALPLDVGIAAFTLIVVLVLSKIKVLSRMSILLGLVCGTLFAIPLGAVNGASILAASPVAFPQPFALGLPTFAIGACISMVIVILVIMVETTADVLAVGEVVGTRVDSKRVAAGLRADMVSSLVAPVFNSFPATAFAQNVGLVAITGIKSRFAVAAGGVVLFVLGLSPFLAAVVGVVPLPVLGGAGIVLFGTVAASGVRTLSKVDYQGNNNLIIVAVSVAFGMLPVVASPYVNFPSWFQTIFDSGISSAAIMAVVLNLFFNVLLPGTPVNPTALSAAPALMVKDTELRHLAQGGTFEAGQEVEVTVPESAREIAREHVDH